MTLRDKLWTYSIIHAGSAPQIENNEAISKFRELVKDLNNNNPEIEYLIKTIESVIDETGIIAPEVLEYIHVIKSNSITKYCGMSKIQPSYIEIMPEKMAIIGDLHGDLCLTKSILNAIPKDATIIQLGDIFDADGRDIKWKESQCKNSVEINRLLKERNAHLIMGNHEILNIESNFSATKKNKYLAADEIPAGTDTDALKKDLICSRVPILVVGGSWIFVHGGLSKSYTQLFEAAASDPIAISILSKYILQNALINESRTSRSKTEKALLVENGGPQWYRGQAEENGCFNIPEEFNGITIAIAHTIQENGEINGIQCARGNRIFRLDTGSSRAFGKIGKPQYLLVSNYGKTIERKEINDGGSMTTKAWNGTGFI